MFEIAYRPGKSRRIQHGIRDLKTTKWKCFCKAFVEALRSFCTISSFAPLRFAFERKRSKIDLFLWITITVALTSFTTSFVQDFLIKFDAMSTKTVLNTNHRPTSTTNFPSITVCATSRFPYTKVYGFLSAYIIRNAYLQSSVNLTKILKSFTLVDATQNDLDEMDIVLKAYNITMIDVYYYTSQSCDELLQVCRWEGEIRPCSQLFKKVFGGGSFCCSFNYPIDPNTKRKIRTTYFGRGKGLSIITRPIRDKFYYHSDYGTNIRILLHHPYSFPLFNENDIFAPMRKETNIDIDSSYNVADQKVRSLPIRQRDCVFNYEMELRHFPIYSHSNCILECRVARIIQACGCATYFFPSINTTICPTSKLYCNIVNQNLEFKTNSDGTFRIENCYCPDDCGRLRIHYRMQSTNFVPNNFSVDEFYDSLRPDNGIVHINYSKSFTRILQRKLVLDEIQLASNVGGIIALFLGCSFISIFEFVYFLSIRLIVNYRRLCIQNFLFNVPMYLE